MAVSFLMITDFLRECVKKCQSPFVSNTAFESSSLSMCVNEPYDSFRFLLRHVPQFTHNNICFDCHSYFWDVYFCFTWMFTAKR